MLHLHNGSKWLLCLLLFTAQLRLNNGTPLDTDAADNAGDGKSLAPTLDGNEMKNSLRIRRSNAMPAAALEKASNVNLTAITWAHAVNSQQELHDVLNSDIEMIEADIVLGTVNNTGPAIPVMAHPPATNSDISLAEFLDRIMSHNAAHANDDVKGVKLDFKTIEVFEGSLNILNDLVPKMDYPIWLNADIVSGPVNQTTSVPVDPQRFLAGCAKFYNAVLSIGWTTRWGPAYRDEKFIYTTDQIDAMMNAIKVNDVTATGHTITFPVRAGIAANSRTQLHELVRAVNVTNRCTITIWSSQNDYVNVEKLRDLIFSFGFDRVYLDVPESLASQLDLGRNAGQSIATARSLLQFTLISGGMVLLSMWKQLL